MKVKYLVVLLMALLLTNIMFSAVAFSSEYENLSVESLLEELETEIESLDSDAFEHPRQWNVMKRNMLRFVRAVMEDVEDGKLQMARLKALRALVQHQLKEPWRTDLTIIIDELLAPPQAELTFWDIPRVDTYEDTLPAGDHLSEVTHRLWIHNLDDVHDADVKDPGFHVETEGVTLTWVDWEQYADWGDTYADWDFPTEFTITEEQGGDGPGFGVDLSEWISLDFEMNRPTDQIVIYTSGTYEASFTLEFTEIDCLWCNGFINAYDQWCLDASIVPGSFTTDAPLNDWGEGGSYGVWFDLDLDSLESGVVYEFSVEIDVEVTDTSAPPILYKPGFGINYLVSTEWRNGVEGDTVEIPPDMRPDYVTEAWVSTEASNVWTLGRRNEINAYMHEVIEQIP